MPPSFINDFIPLLIRQWTFTPPPPKQRFDGKTVIVTGSNIGLGFEAAKHITRLGAAKVILAVRSLQKGNAARDAIVKETGVQNVVEVWELDLASFASVKAFANRANSTLDRLDSVVANAGIASSKFEISEKMETAIVVNVVSTYLLSALLLPKLRETAAQHKPSTPTLVIVSSEVHAWTKIKPERDAAATSKFADSKTPLFDALSDPKAADMPERYPTTKLMEILALNEWMKNSTINDVVITTLTPGFCHSALMREVGAWQYIFKFVMGARTTEVGGRTLVHAAAADSSLHGKYLQDCAATPVAPWVTSADGVKVGEEVWRELKIILEGIEPGVTKNFQ